MIKIGIADSQTIIRAGLRGIIESENIKVIGEAWSANSVLKLVKDNEPDILLLDSNLPDIDIFLLKDILREHFSCVKIIALIEKINLETICRFIQSSFHGVLTKASSYAYLHAIKAVHAGHFYCQPDLAYRIVGFERRELMLRLSNREYIILESYIRQEKTQNIAERLRLSPKTVLNIKLRALEKLQMPLDYLRKYWIDK